MEKGKFTCRNTGCKHHTTEEGCAFAISLDERGRCESFEKGFPYYFHLVWDALRNTYFINAVELTPDLRIGLYYVMTVYGLGFSEQEWGTSRLLSLTKGAGMPGLGYEEIIALKKDEKKLLQLYEDFNRGILPGASQRPLRQAPLPFKDFGFGWLSPTGVFSESPFGHHEESAEAIVASKGFEAEYDAWQRENRSGPHLMRDLLTEVKGYALIHNPSGCGGYLVTRKKPLTKWQREFLYDYFMKKGDRFKAETFLEDKT